MKIIFFSENNNFKEDRKRFQVLTNYGERVSPLKKKLTIISKIKTITRDTFDSLICELKLENMSKFHVEIVNNILFHLENPTCYIFFRILEISYLYSFDPAFLGYLYSEIKKSIQKRFSYSCFFLELLYLKNNSEISQAVLKIMKQLAQTDKVGFIYYILTNGNPEYPLPNSTLDYLRETIAIESENPNDSSIDILKKTIEILNLSIKVKEKQSIFNSVKFQTDEFIFYTAKEFKFFEAELVIQSINKNSNDTKKMNHFILSILNGTERWFKVDRAKCFKGFYKVIDELDCMKTKTRTIFEPIFTGECGFIAFLDFLGLYIKGHPKIFKDLWNRIKKMKDPTDLKYYCRILLKVQPSASQISSIEAKSPSKFSLFELNFIGELMKFNILKTNYIFELLFFYLENRLIDHFTVLFETVARFLIFSNQSTDKIDLIFQKINSIKVSQIDKLLLEDCTSKILNSNSFQIDILSFFSWVFNNYYQKKQHPSFLHDLALSKKLLYCIFIQPNLFKNIQCLIYWVHIFQIEKDIYDFYLEMVGKFKTKSLLFKIVEILSNLKHKNGFELIYNRIKESKLKKEVKYKCYLLILDSVVKDKDWSILKPILEFAAENNNLEIKSMLFNIKEKHKINIPLPKIEDEDSFDAEINLLRNMED